MGGTKKFKNQKKDSKGIPRVERNRKDRILQGGKGGATSQRGRTFEMQENLFELHSEKKKLRMVHRIPGRREILWTQQKGQQGKGGKKTKEGNVKQKGLFPTSGRKGALEAKRLFVGKWRFL